MSEENVAIVKSSWAGWRQGLHDQWVRDFAPGLEERAEGWAETAGNPDLQPEEFLDEGDVVLVRARSLGPEPQTYWFRYVLDGARIADWQAYEDEAAARAGG